mmetsp:Transcript_13474/g.38261  ORF Transcript_13474/g.38261 Transcript_13474/m.38261 type:complete len:252 (-) Transcript_13474:657-1412(-)
MTGEGATVGALLRVPPRVPIIVFQEMPRKVCLETCQEHLKRPGGGQVIVGSNCNDALKQWGELGVFSQNILQSGCQLLSTSHPVDECVRLELVPKGVLCNPHKLWVVPMEQCQHDHLQARFLKSINGFLNVTSRKVLAHGNNGWIDVFVHKPRGKCGAIQRLLVHAHYLFPSQMLGELANGSDVDLHREGCPGKHGIGMLVGQQRRARNCRDRELVGGAGEQCSDGGLCGAHGPHYVVTAIYVTLQNCFSD